MATEQQPPTSVVQHQDLVSGFRDLGLQAGDLVMVHASLSAYGHVQGGAPTVVAALLEVLTDTGTLVVPTFSKYLYDEPVWDREHTPSLMGKISETVRTWPGALRSSHAAHSLAAVGARAERICRPAYRTGFGPDSPFQTLVEEDAWILLMGVTYSNCTLFHLLEAEAEVPYRFLERRPAAVIIDGIRDEDGGAWEYTRYPGVANDFLTLGQDLEARGLVFRGAIGQAEQRLFRAREACEVGRAAVASNPLYLLTPESQAAWRIQH